MKKPPPPPLTVEAAAKARGCSERRIRQYIAEGKLAAQKVGRDWLIDPKALAALPEFHPGRPPKPEGAA